MGKKWKLLVSITAVLSIALLLSASISVNANDGLANVPRPVKVTVQTSTTALLLLDFTHDICGTKKVCVNSIPNVVALASKAQAAGALIVCSHAPIPGDTILSQIAPFCEQTVSSMEDKFYGTTLNTILQDNGITTVVIGGTVSHGAVLYTSYEANARGYTVVIAGDCISDPNAFAAHYSLYQLLNVPGSFSNPTNIQLKPGAVTLSMSSLITFET